MAATDGEQGGAASSSSGSAGAAASAASAARDTSMSMSMSSLGNGSIGSAPAGMSAGGPMADGPGAASPCTDNDDLELPEGLALPAATACFSEERLRAADYPRASATAELSPCPAASRLDWGPVSAGCSFQPRCDTPVDDKDRGARSDEDAGVSPGFECCYWVTAVCGG